MARRDVKSIGEEIDELARLTGAPVEFVEQVRGLFTKKAISLDENAEPYVAALEEAFRREEMIRAYSEQIRRNLTTVQSSLGRLGDAARENLRHLGRARESLEPHARRAFDSEPRPEDDDGAPAGRRRGAREAILGPMVPGPKDLQ